MAKYSVIYREPGNSRPKQITMDSFGESYLRAECEGKGWQVLLIRAAENLSFGARLHRAFTGKLKFTVRLSVSTAELCMFCEVMRSLYLAGVQMLQILEMCIEEEGNGWFKKRLLIVQERLRGGDDLSTAMGDPRCVKAFPLLMRETVRIGEANGRLGDSLTRLIATFKRAVETKRETISAMTYPAIAMIVFFAVGAVISMKIPPLLLEIVGAKDIDKIYSQLPAAIRLLFYIYDHPVCLLYPPLLAVGLIVLWRVGMKYHATRIALTRFQRRVWMIGPLLYQFALVRFLDMLAANHETGIQISDSLALIQGTVGDAIISDSLGRIREQIVTKGASLSSAISHPREAEIYPGLVRQMIRAGEESGKLAAMLRPIVDFYENQAKALLRRTMDMMTPAMIILLGAMIGPVIIGVYKTLILLSKAAAS
ncbi:MAG: type II secretion system F family protein [Kiritimatiellia bacterium]